MGSIVLMTCEHCGCDSAKVANAKPAPCQFCGKPPRPLWQAAYDCAPPHARGRKRRAAREARV